MDSLMSTCSNCNKQFESTKVQLHEAYCLRNFRKCTQCEEYVDRHELQEHNQEKHIRQSCKYHCGQELLDSEVNSHLKICTKKPQRCTFCGLDIDFQEFDEHISHCGARTKECLICRKSVILFDYDLHEQHCLGTQFNMFPKISESYSNQKQIGIGKEEKLKKNQTEKQKNRDDEEVSLKKQVESNKTEVELAQQVKQANSSGDKELMKKLQMEQDEWLAQEWQKQFSPKKEIKDQKQSQQFFSKEEEEQDGYDYNYDYDQEEEEDDYYQDEDDSNEQEENVIHYQRKEVNGINTCLSTQD